MGVLWFYQSSQGESQIGLLCTSAQRTPPCLSFNEGLSDFLVSPVVKTLSSSAMAVGSIPGQEAKIPHAFQSNIQTSNRSNTVRNSFVVVQSLCHIQLSVSPWTAAQHASLSLTISRSLPKLVPTESWCSPTISSPDALFL